MHTLFLDMNVIYNEISAKLLYRFNARPINQKIDI